MKRKTEMTGKKSLGQRLLAAPHIVWSVLFIIAPLAVVAFYAMTDSSFSFTVSNFSQIFSDGTSSVFALSLAFAFFSTVICLLIAYPLAYFISRCKPRNAGMLIMLFMLPMWMNFLLRTYALSFLLEDTGPLNKLLELIGLGRATLINTSGAVILGMVYNFLPYMLLPIYSVMSKIDRSLIEAAEDLGCNRTNIMFKVIMPLSIPGVVSGITMVFVPSVSTFYISQQLGPTDFVLIGDVIETYFKSSAASSYHVGSAISLVLMVLIFICMAVMNRFSDGDTGGALV